MLARASAHVKKATVNLQGLLRPARSRFEPKLGLAQAAHAVKISPGESRMNSSALPGSLAIARLALLEDRYVEMLDLPDQC